MIPFIHIARIEILPFNKTRHLIGGIINLENNVH